MSMKPCMGGWCRQRESCSHYLAGTDEQRAEAAERLCERWLEMPIRHVTLKPSVILELDEAKVNQ